MAAQTYIHDEGDLMQPGQWGAFWTHDSKPADSDGAPMQAEAVVILRDAIRADIVQLRSFLDMQGALTYLRALVAKGFDLGSALLYWVTPVPLNVSVSTAPKVADEEEPAAAISTNRLRPSGGNRVSVSADSQQSMDPRQSENKPQPVVTEDGGKGPSLLSRMFGPLWEWPGWNGLPSRIVQVALLKEETYESVSRDPHATGRAAVVVIAGAVAAGIGAPGGGAAPAIGYATLGLVGWIVCAVVVQIIGREVFGGRIVSSGAVPQTVGLASAPALLLVLGAVPIYGPLLVLGIFAWLLVVMTLAVEQSLELNRESAILTASFGWLLFFAIAQVAPKFLV